ncbi:AAA family ATPase [Arcobacter cloacae]|uniref:Cell division protein FtsH n=1 Tax=Arcobacter cloacae TaxID=1054034 RepID=A0A6M8N7E0_9BACT|nr:AAA family ATPase [Arcobacter cloacae]QKF89983.1 integral membrane ATP-dependent zinc metallopeptidase [Arcobacter cloacae]RXI40257.1 cell division protein FtsH [Arcobacter cloacae]
MLQDSNKKNIDKNLKLMAISAIVLLILFVYTIYKSSSHIQGSSYYVGIIFLFVLLFLALLLKFKEDKVKAFFNKNKKQSSAFDNELIKTRAKISNEDLNSNIKAVTSNVTFKDVAGIKEIKEELEEIVDFLNNPKKYLEFGVKLPKGVLLVGPPGVGKTLIARAVAGEADVPFFYQSGASFVHIYVGMGAKKVRELFAKAKQSAPAIVFIDEIDAVGKARSGKSNDERESTLNELLTQMDGFDGDSGVIVIAATNKIEVLDDALLRAGRFDRRVHVGLPNIEDRKKILELYLNGKNHEINIEKLVNETAGFSSASLATLINEALLYMIKTGKKILENEDIEIAKNKLEFGKKQIKILDDEQKDILATYQASKAFISKTKVALLDESVQKLNSTFPSYLELCENIRRDLAGFIGVEVIKKEKYAVNPNDLENAENIANEIVNRYKMATSTQELLLDIKNDLRTKISSNIDEIIRLKEIMLKNEVITLEDF